MRYNGLRSLELKYGETLPFYLNYVDKKTGNICN